MTAGRATRTVSRSTSLRSRRAHDLDIARPLLHLATERDRVHVELLTRKSSAANGDLESLALTASTPQVRVQALSALAGLDGANASVLERAMRNAHPHLRQHALRLSEPILRVNPPQNLASAVLSLTNDSSQLVANQLALTLGEWKDKRAGEALAILALKFRENTQFRVCALTSAGQPGHVSGDGRLLGQLLGGLRHQGRPDGGDGEDGSRGAVSG